MEFNDKIIIGPLSNPLFIFAPNDIAHQIKSITGATAVDLVGSELSIDQLTPTLSYPARMVAEVFAPSDYDGIYTSDGYLFAHILPQKDIRKVPYGTPVYWLRGNAIVGKFYWRPPKRTPPYLFAPSAVSPVGVLDDRKHLGGVYNGERFDAVLADIIGDAIPYSVSPDVAGLEVYNWLPIAESRYNLHQLLFAYGVAIKKDANGDAVFGFLSGDPKEVTLDRIYNTGSVTDESPATAVEVIEHSYQALDGVAPVTLFDNTAELAVIDQFIPFDSAPAFDLQTTGNLTLKSSGANWAIVSGSGVLTGKPYTHLQRTVSVRADNPDVQQERLLRPASSDLTLINRVNSYNVARRLLSYYSSAKTVIAEFSLSGEHAGDQVVFTDPFGERTTGYIESMELSVSTNVKARCRIITDYVPKPETAQFNRVELLTGAGVYIVPAGVYLLRVAIMQAGSGGSSGTNGEAAEAMKEINESYSSDYIPQAGGAGGIAGVAGLAGRVLVVDIPVTPGQSIQFSCGVAGVGGALGAVSNPGSVGAHSTFGNYTSASGTLYPDGWTEPISGVVYAKPGKPGVPGGAGSGVKHTISGGYFPTDYELVPGNSITVDGIVYSPGNSYWTDSLDGRIGKRSLRVFGSCGGGFAYGRPGPDGKRPDEGHLPTQDALYAQGPIGGAGADAVFRGDAAEYGSGGHGGCGGGGAGASGGCAVDSIDMDYIKKPLQAAPGKGTRGSNGGSGAIWVYHTDPTATGV